jgi:hypothetical protein
MVDHLAVHFDDDAARKLRVINKLDELIKPHVADKGYDWEFHIDETPRELWKIDGFIPPPRESCSARGCKVFWLWRFGTDSGYRQE